MKVFKIYIILLIGSVNIFLSCGNKEVNLNNKQNNTEIKNNVKSSNNLSFDFASSRTFNHDENAFTQGLFIEDGKIYESTGLNGSSSLRLISIGNGEILKKQNIQLIYFSEGIAPFGNDIYMLTYKNGKCLVYDKESFTFIKSFDYQGEGWGLTTDGSAMYMSDGTHQIKVIDPINFNTTRIIDVIADNYPLEYINELEWIEGEIWANIWGQDVIVRINPITGRVIETLDFRELRKSQVNNERAEVLNGIAYNKSDSTVVLTGKNWNLYFEYKLKFD